MNNNYGQVLLTEKQLEISELILQSSAINFGN